MTNNTATLIYHVGQSINKQAAKLDAKIYGPMTNHQSRSMPPQPKEERIIGFWDAFIGIFCAIMFFAWVFAWLGRYERVRDRFFR